MRQQIGSWTESLRFVAVEDDTDVPAEVCSCQFIWYIMFKTVQDHLPVLNHESYMMTICCLFMLL